MKINRLLPALAAVGALALGAAACGGNDTTASSGSGSSGDGELTGTIRIDGSSTVFPFAEAAAELFNEDNPGVKITTGQSGTGGGFEKFCAGETDISDASRPIKADEEVPVCEKGGVKYGEVQIANDGIAVVTNKNLAVDCLTTAQLKKLWNKGSKATSLRRLDPKLPATKLSLYGPGTDSGTFDFFTAEINGEEGVTREDYEASEDDNQLVTGVAGDEGGLGYFGFSYKPLSRPLFMYPSAKSLQRPEVKAFMDFTVANAEEIATAAKIVPMTAEQATMAKQEIGDAEAKAGA